MLKPNEKILLMKSLARKYDSQRTRGLFIEVRENISFLFLENFVAIFKQFG